MINKPDYSWKAIDNFIVIWDENNGKVSVTNGIETVLNDINKQVSLLGKTIIYRDPQGIYTQVYINKNIGFQAFETPAKKELMVILGIASLNMWHVHSRLSSY